MELTIYLSIYQIYPSGVVRPHPGQMRGDQRQRVRLQRGQDSVPGAAAHLLLRERARVQTHRQQGRPRSGKWIIT